MKLFLVFTSLFICHNIYSFQEALNNSSKTRSSYENFMFSWTAVFGDKTTNHYEVDAIHLHGQSKLDLYAVTEDEKKLISTTYISKEKWHVIEGEKRTIYRPFEADYKMVKTYQYLMKSKLQFLNAKNARYLGKYKGNINQKHHFNVAVSQAEKEAIRHQINLLRNKLIPNAQTRAEESFYLRKAESLFKYIKEGKLNLVDLSGIVTKLDTPDGLVEIINLKVATMVDSSLIQPQGTFTDLTNEPDWQNSAIFSYSGTWKPGMPIHSKDSRIINIKTGNIRRLAFKGTLSTPQAIDRPNSTIYLTGTTPGSPHIKPFTYNFKTSVLKPLGPISLHRGRVEQIALSPNSEKLAILHNLEPHLGDFRQLIILELKTKQMKTYKTSGNPQKICWHSNNNSIFYSHYNKTNSRSLISLHTPGKVTNDILEGSHPTLSPNGKTLIFLDLKDQLWKEASLNGEKAHIFLNGLPKLQFPAIRPNNTALFIQQGEEHWPTPVMYDLKTGKTTPLTSEKGLWLTPIW